VEKNSLKPKEQLLVPILKDLVNAIIFHQKKFFFPILKEKGFIKQSNNDFTDFFVNYIHFKLKSNVFNMISEFYAQHFAKQVLRKAYFRRFLLYKINTLLKNSRKFIRMTDIIYTVSYHFKQQISRIFLNKLVRSLILNINDKRKYLLISLLDEGFKDNHLPIYSNKKFSNNKESTLIRLYNFDEEGRYIRNIYSYKWYDDTPQQAPVSKIKIKKEKLIYEYFSNFVGKLNNDLMCKKCKHQIHENVYCLKCSTHKWENDDLIHIYNSENAYVHKKKRKNKFLEELSIQKGISDTLEAKTFCQLTPTNFEEDNNNPLKHNASDDKYNSEEYSSLKLKYRITQTQKSADTKKFNINDVFKKINRTKKSPDNMTENLKESLNLDNKSIFSYIDTGEKMNESIVSVKKYTITTQRLTNNISSAMKTLKRNADKKEMIVLRDEERDVMK
jgi:hypothetical protein